MGRQLAFWKYEDGIYLDNKEVYKKSCGDGEEISGLTELPKEEILNKIKREFKDYERLDEYNYGGELGSFTVYLNEKGLENSDICVEYIEEYKAFLSDSLS